MSAFLILFTLAVGALILILLGLYLGSRWKADAAQQHRNKLKLTKANQERRTRYRNIRLKRAAQRKASRLRTATHGNARRQSGKMARRLARQAELTAQQGRLRRVHRPQLIDWHHTRSSRLLPLEKHFERIDR